MSRRKKPEETTEATHTRRIKDTIANAANRSEKTSWNRKMDNMVKLLAALSPIEQQIIDLQAKKIPLFDEIQALRLQMVNECIHPYEYLVIDQEGLSLTEGKPHEPNKVRCKFCDRKLSIAKLGYVLDAGSKV